MEALPFYEAEAKERQGERTDLVARMPRGSTKSQKAAAAVEAFGKARDHAARAVGAGARYVQDAKAIRERAPERFEQIKAGKALAPGPRRQSPPSPAPKPG